jgi:hypothetical protein
MDTQPYLSTAYLAECPTRCEGVVRGHGLPANQCRYAIYPMDSPLPSRCMLRSGATRNMNCVIDWSPITRWT